MCSMAFYYYRLIKIHIYVLQIVEAVIVNRLRMLSFCQLRILSCHFHHQSLTYL